MSIHQEMGPLLERYLADAQSVAEMEKLAKNYPRVSNVENMKVPRLDAEVFQFLDQPIRNADQSLQGIQKGVMGAMSAFAPVLDLAARGQTSVSDLDQLSDNLLDGFQLLAHVHKAILSRGSEATPFTDLC